MAQAKVRVLIVGAVVPATDRGGGCLALHRHFCLRRDFEVAIASTAAAGSSCVQRFEIRASAARQRLKRTRFARLAQNLDYVCAGWRLPAGLLEFARAWRPDVVFTVVDDTHAMLAHRLARTLGVPLAVNFQDLFAFSNFTADYLRPYRGLRSLLAQRYRFLQENADAVFHTSEGMRSWFGAAQRGEVLYPIGDFDPTAARPPTPGNRRRLIYAGNCYGAYGRMLLRLAAELESHRTIAFEIYTMGNDWPTSAAERFTQSGILRGYQPFEQLKARLENADAFLTTMSFEAEERVFVQTSFTTKWLDYAPWGKPIFAWAPAYSTAAVFATRTGAGVAIAEDDPAAVVRTIEQTLNDPQQTASLARAALDAARTELDAERLHRLLLERIEALVSRNSGAQAGQK